MKTCGARSVGILSIVALLAIGTQPRPVLAQLPNEPLGDQVVVDGMVLALAKTNQVLYLGGLFSGAGGAWEVAHRCLYPRAKSNPASRR